MKKYLDLILVLLLFSAALFGRSANEKLFLVRAQAKDKYERSRIADTGVAIDAVFSDSVTFIATNAEIQRLRRSRVPLEITELPKRERDFPTADGAFHNYAELVKALDEIAQKYPKITERFSIGHSLEGRSLEGIRISSIPQKDTEPSAIFLGCHHAREHLSVEVPLKLAQYLTENYARDSRIRELLDTREVWIVPMVNPDGAEYDIASGTYKYWRKNRRDLGKGLFGVDLNRNYGPKEFFAGSGSSHSPASDTYHGPHEFSEPETQAVRDFVRARTSATMLLTFHTFSELILWPYGHTYYPVPNSLDLKVFETIGKKFATWNHYTPEKTSDLYLASGDTTDWAYEELKLFAFTFELSPNSIGLGGFYPGAAAIEPTFKANLEPALYLIEQAANPFAVVSEGSRVDPLRVK